MGLFLKVEDGWTRSFLIFFCPKSHVVVTAGHGHCMSWAFHISSSLESVSYMGMSLDFIF